jgi:hypothetical protein
LPHTSLTTSTLAKLFANVIALITKGGQYNHFTN